MTRRAEGAWWGETLQFTPAERECLLECAGLDSRRPSAASNAFLERVARILGTHRNMAAAVNDPPRAADARASLANIQSACDALVEALDAADELSNDLLEEHGVTDIEQLKHALEFMLGGAEGALRSLEGVNSRGASPDYARRTTLFHLASAFAGVAGGYPSAEYREGLIEFLTAALRMAGVRFPGSDDAVLAPGSRKKLLELVPEHLLTPSRRGS